MNINASDPTVRLRDCRVGVALAVVTIAFGFAIGGAFGAFEDQIKGDLAARASAVQSTVYGDDATKIKPVLDKCWTYYKRAHLHAGAIGGAAVGLIVLLSLLERPSARARRAISLVLGAGGLGYSLFWALAARAAPGLGGTDAAKESLSWLAVPSAALLLSGLFAVLGLTLVELFRRSQP